MTKLASTIVMGMSVNSQRNYVNMTIAERMNETKAYGCHFYTHTHTQRERERDTQREGVCGCLLDV